MKTFNQFIVEANWGKQPLPKEKMLNQIRRHSNYAGWVTGMQDNATFNRRQSAPAAKAIADRSHARAQGIVDVLMGKEKKKKQK